MPANRTYVCVPCRLAKKNAGWSNDLQAPICERCKGVLIEKHKWSAPKKNNDRAWKRIESGDWLWDHHRVRRAEKGRRKSDTKRVRKFEILGVEGFPRIKRRVPITGTEAIVTNYDRLPIVNLGG